MAFSSQSVVSVHVSPTVDDRLNLHLFGLMTNFVHLWDAESDAFLEGIKQRVKKKKKSFLTVHSRLVPFQQQSAGESILILARLMCVNATLKAAPSIDAR